MSKYEGRLPKTYAEAEQFLGPGWLARTLPMKSTRIARVKNGEIVVMHYGTVIARFEPCGRVTFTTDGHSTWSTHQRLNAMVTPLVEFRTEDGEGVVRIRRGKQVERASTRHYNLVRLPSGEYVTRKIDEMEN